MKKYLFISLLSLAAFVSVHAEKKTVLIDPNVQSGNNQRDDFPRSPIRIPSPNTFDNANYNFSDSLQYVTVSLR
ncbi:MAG: hypothetical protein MJZ36_07830 [Bacteroidaceae bacterium]|nr:hypothetical protein [Bacteroidaceae bacterium]